MYRVSNFITNALCIISVLLTTWILLSYIDIILHNTTTCTYQSWNLIVMAFGA